MTRTCLLLVMAIMLALAGCGGGDGDSDRAVEGDMMQPGGGDGMRPDDMELEVTEICDDHQGTFRFDTLASGPPLSSSPLLFNNVKLRAAGDVGFEQCLLEGTVAGEVQQHGWRWNWPLDGQEEARGLLTAIYGHKFWMTEPTPRSEIPIQVSQILQLEALDASFEVEVMVDPDSRYILRLDLLFYRDYPPANNPPGERAVVANVLIRLVEPTDWSRDTAESPVTLGGHTYNVLHDPQGYFGPTTVLVGRDSQFISGTIVSGTIDLKAVLQEMVDRGFVMPHNYLGSIELNALVFEGAGEVWVLEYEVDVVE